MQEAMPRIGLGAQYMASSQPKRTLSFGIIGGQPRTTVFNFFFAFEDYRICPDKRSTMYTRSQIICMEYEIDPIMYGPTLLYVYTLNVVTIQQT
jgi:hypothetical protein